MSSEEGVNRYAKEAVIGGLVGGALSAIPMLQFFNLACCSLNMGGAALGIWMWFNNHPGEQLTNADVAISGAISGVVAGVLSTLGDFLTRLLLGPIFVAFAESSARHYDIPSELVSMLTQTMTDPLTALYSAPFNVGLFGGFGIVGSLLAGQLAFKDRIQP